MTTMDELIPAYEREVAPLGGYDAQYPLSTPAEESGMLGDAFGQAQLDGYFATSTYDPDAQEVTPDLSTAGQALVVIYAGIRTLKNDLYNTKSRLNYVAGPVQYEVEQAASVLTALLNEATARRDALLASAKAGKGTPVYQTDSYTARVIVAPWGLGWLPSEIGQI